MGETTAIAYLPRGLDALDDSQADHNPSHQQWQRHLPVQPACVVDSAGDVKSLTVPEVSGGWALLTLWLNNYSMRGEVSKRKRAAEHIIDTLASVSIQNVYSVNVAESQTLSWRTFRKERKFNLKTLIKYSVRCDFLKGEYNVRSKNSQLVSGAVKHHSGFLQGPPPMRVATHGITCELKSRHSPSLSVDH